MGCTWYGAKKINQIDPEKPSRMEDGSHADQSVPGQIEESVNQSMNDGRNHLTVADQSTLEKDQRRSSQIDSGTSNKHELFPNSSNNQQAGGFYDDL